jgi:hypothetical protein
MGSNERHQQFAADMELAGYEVHDYRGRNFYSGPAVKVDHVELQDVIQATSVPLQWDRFGETGLVIYPISREGERPRTTKEQVNMAQDLARLNSLTKYPSIPTYHALGERGVLLDRQVEFDGDVFVTEKVDGSNGRIVLLPHNDWLIGSREEWLTAKGDRIPNPALGMVEVLSPVAAWLSSAGAYGDESGSTARTFYFEVYGSKHFPAWKAYGIGTPAVRLFDISVAPLDLLARVPEWISRWREDGGQQFMREQELQETEAELGLKLTPRLSKVDGKDIPISIEDTHAWLKATLPMTRASIEIGGTGKPKGVVVRAHDRSRIAKVRFEDYERTAKRATADKGTRSRATQP